ncbi:MAG: LAGLIDADG family homing endonuclease [Chloroflexota bacterium]
MRKVGKQRAKRYARHIPLAEDKRVRGYRTLPLEWSETMAYVVGLLATDGCLSSDRRHIILTSRDRQLVETFLVCLGRPIKYTVGRTRRGKRAYYAQFSDVTFYDWLLTRGLTPRKSLTLGAIDVPDAYLIPLVRGLLDGDGSVCVFRNKPTRAKYPDYEYERLWVFFLSASRAHIDWLHARIRESFGLKGYVERIVRKNRHDLFRLKYGKRESIVLLRLLYSDQVAPCLDRKRRKWIDYATRHACAEGGI